MPENKKFQINGNTLKMIAIITMAIDHIGAVIIENGVLDALHFDYFMSLIQTQAGVTWYLFDLLLRLIGRVAFPIFCFLLVEGYFHTRSRKKYAIRLLIFAAVSEIPFDLAVTNQLLEFGAQNVFFTLFLGVVAMEILERLKGKKVLQILAAAAVCGSAIVLRTDYNAFGIIVILAFYLFHGNRRKAMLMGGIASALESISLFGAAALAIIPISRYNGERGTMNLKYFFYAFYPVHLLVLYVVRVLFVHSL